MISRNKFCKETLECQSFTFCDWIYSVLKLIRKYFQELWCDGHIAFISRENAQKTLHGYPKGTFLLRFADIMDQQYPHNAGISIVLVKNDMEFLHVMPFFYKDFSIRTLSSRINNIDNLIYLHPRIPKSEVFGPRFEHVSKSSGRFDRYCIGKTFS